MKFLFLMILFCNVFFIFNTKTFAQKYELPTKPTLDTAQMPNILDKKQYFGFEYNNSWTSINFGSHAEPYFFKPSLGGHFVYNRFLTKNIGFGIGLGFQQRGAGIFYPDETGDSTTRFRLRFNHWEMPLNLIWRSNKCIGKGQGVKWSGSIGVIPSYNFWTTRIYLDLTGSGNHTRDNQSNDFSRFDALVSGTFGVDIAVATYSVLRIQGYGNVGLLKVYRNDLANFTGNNTLFGIKIGFLF
jgi:hypothetical protein